MRTGYATRNEKQQQQKNQSEVSEAAARLQLIFKGREVQSGVCSGSAGSKGAGLPRGAVTSDLTGLRVYTFLQMLQKDSGVLGQLR